MGVMGWRWGGDGRVGMGWAWGVCAGWGIVYLYGGGFLT